MSDKPMFKSDPTGVMGEKYRTRTYDAERRRSIIVQSAGVVELHYHMHGASYVSLDFTAEEARAIAAELIAAADALDAAQWAQS